MDSRGGASASCVCSLRELGVSRLLRSPMCPGSRRESPLKLKQEPHCHGHGRACAEVKTDGRWASLSWTSLTTSCCGCALPSSVLASPVQSHRSYPSHCSVIRVVLRQEPCPSSPARLTLSSGNTVTMQPVLHSCTLTQGGKVCAQVYARAQACLWEH